MKNTQFTPFADDADVITPENFDKCLDYCRARVEIHVDQYHKEPPFLSLEALSAIAVYLHDSGLADNIPEVRRMISRHIFQSNTRYSGGRHVFQTLKAGDSVLIPRSSDARIRQALVRFRARQPLWNFTLRSIPINPYLMVLTRTA